MLSVPQIKARMQKANPNAACSLEFYGDDIHLVWKTATRKTVLVFDMYYITVSNKDFQREMFNIEKQMQE